VGAEEGEDRGDWILLRHAREGDAGAWEALWRRHRDRVFRVALAVTHDRESARDVAQNVLLRLVDGPPPARQENLARYLATAAWRAAVRVERGLQRLESLEVVAESATVADGTEDGERRDTALQVLESLPPAQRDTLVLRLVGGLSYEETAHVLDIPVGTVRSRLHAGIRACRDTLRRKGRLT
jgi:RNA polymerase sigma-70 factor (ECF subfamily)